MTGGPACGQGRRSCGSCRVPGLLLVGDVMALKRIAAFIVASCVALGGCNTTDPGAMKPAVKTAACIAAAAASDWFASRLHAACTEASLKCDLAGIALKEANDTRRHYCEEL